MRNNRNQAAEFRGESPTFDAPINEEENAHTHRQRESSHSRWLATCTAVAAALRSRAPSLGVKTAASCKMATEVLAGPAPGGGALVGPPSSSLPSPPPCLPPSSTPRGDDRGKPGLAAAPASSLAQVSETVQLAAPSPPTFAAVEAVMRSG